MLTGRCARRAPVATPGGLLHASGTPVFMPASQEVPASPSPGRLSLQSYQTATIKGSSWQVTTPRVLHKDTPFLCERGLSCSFGLRVRIQVWHISRGLQRPVDANLALALSRAPAHWYLPERTLYTCLVPQFLQCHQGTPPGSLAMVASSAYAP